MSQSIETDRLYGHPITESDFEDLYRLNQDPEVAETMAGTRNRAETLERIKSWTADWQHFGYGIWMVYEKTSHAFVGRAGLAHLEIDGKDEVELLYALMPEFWGQGLATELGREVVHKAFEQPGIKELICFTLPSNSKSLRVMEKLGFVYERGGMHAGLPHSFYRLKRVFP